MPFDDRDFPNLPRGERAISPHSRRMVAVWLYIVAFMILVMVALGGATRLTGSGLSIMEWAPVMGVLPPLSDAEWDRLFALYRHIPQYDLLNAGFGLDGFKRIFWLEWSHRLWGRLIGVVFLVPLIWFALTRRLDWRLMPRLVTFFVLGGLQGAVGWFMVASGFQPGAAAVEPVRLVLHLAFALLLYAAVLWTALTLWPPGPRLAGSGPGLRIFAWATLGLTALTMVAGGFVAGLHAGLTYNTFPLMDGRLVPDGYTDLEPFARNLIENIAAVQFNHRLLASLTLLAASGLTIAALPYREQLGWRVAFVGAAAGLQYILGVSTLLLVVPVGLAVMHQVCATILLTAVLLVVHAIRPRLGFGLHGARPEGGRDAALARAKREDRSTGGSAGGSNGSSVAGTRGGATRGEATRGGAKGGLRGRLRGGAAGATKGATKGDHGQTARGTPFYGSVTPSAVPRGTEDPKS